MRGHTALSERHAEEGIHLQQLVRAAAVRPLQHVHLPLHAVPEQLPRHQIVRDFCALLEDEGVWHPDDLRERGPGSCQLPNEGSASQPHKLICSAAQQCQERIARNGHLQYGLNLSIHMRLNMVLP